MSNTIGELYIQYKSIWKIFKLHYEV